MTGLVCAAIHLVLAQPTSVSVPAAPTPAVSGSNLTGTVRHLYTDKPVAGAVVRVRGHALRAVTDAAGAFTFARVPLGTHTVDVRRAGFARESVEVTLRQNKRLHISVALRPDDGSVIVITERLRGKRRQEVVETTIDQDEGTQVAGTQGDIVRAVQTLGGVARSQAGASDLVIWGASPSETRLYVDDVPVPRLFHIGGRRSILSSPMVSSVSLIPGGFGADYGRAIGGMVKVTSAEPTDSRVQGFLSADPIDLSGAVSSRWSGATWTSASARTSVQNRALDLVAADRARELVPVADYWDYQVKARHEVNLRDTISVLGFGVRDRVRRGIPSVTPDAAFNEDAESGFHRLSVRFERHRSERISSIVAGWIGVDHQKTTQDFTHVTAVASQRAWRAGLRLGERRDVRSWVSIHAGLDVEVARTAWRRDGALSLPAREGDVTVFGQPPGDRINMDSWRTDVASAGAYAAAQFSMAGGRVTAEPGVRFEPSLLNGNRVVPVRPTEPAVGYTELQPTLDPRLRVTWTPTKRLRIYGGAGRYHQTADPADLSPVFGTPVLGQAESLQALGGVWFEPAFWLNVETTGFWIRQRSLAVRASSPAPALATLLTTEGQGRNYGAQTVLRFRPSARFFAWLTYSLMRAQRRSRAGEPWRLFDVDQTHAAQAVASYRHRSGVELGARLQASTGAPRTPVTAALYNAGTGLHDPVFGGHNSIRIPAFFELSVRVAWQRSFAWGKVKVWLDVQNATNRSNAEEIFYAADYSSSGHITGLPILPLVGVQAQL